MAIGMIAAACSLHISVCVDAVYLGRVFHKLPSVGSSSQCQFDGMFGRVALSIA